MLAMTARHEIANWVDRRTAIRHKLRLSVPETSPVSGAPVSGAPVSGAAVSGANALVRSLSTNGALIECAARLAVGEMLEVGLPGAVTVKSRIVWSDGKLVGCRFEPPISRAMLNAALLKGVNLSKVAAPRWSDGAIERPPGKREGEIWPRSLRIAMIFGVSLSMWAGIAFSLGVIPG